VNSLQIFDKISCDYHKYRRPKRLIVKRLQALIAEFGNPSSIVLDIGCGTGSYLNELTSIEPMNKVGMDLSLNMLSQGRSPKTDSLLVQADFNSSFPFSDKSFDLIIAVDCLHFAKDLSLTLNEVCRVLKRNGIFIAALHTPDDIKRQTLSKYFPQAELFDLQEANSLMPLCSVGNSLGMECIRAYNELEEFEPDNHFIEIFERKCASVLNKIDTECFEVGLKNLKSDLANANLVGIESHTIYIFNFKNG
jgi:ubiquinone/menaquinone biosynthesis C-methylase UbiE